MSVEEIILELEKLNCKELKKVDVKLHQLLAEGSVKNSHPTWGAALLELAGSVDGLPADFAHNHNQYLHGLRASKAELEEMAQCDQAAADALTLLDRMEPDDEDHVKSGIGRNDREGSLQNLLEVARHFPAGSSAPHDLAQHHDHYLYGMPKRNTKDAS